MINNEQKIKGFVDICIEDRRKNKISYTINNAILKSGKSALAMSLANELSGQYYPFYVNSIVFGSGGMVDGKLRTVNSDRSSLFGSTVISKPIISSIDPNIPTQATFTSVLTFDDAIGQTINEMALKMANESLYSMVTFPDLMKTKDIQITWNWRINFI